MWYSKRAIDTTAVINLAIIDIVAVSAEVSCAKAVVQGYRAAEVAFPIDMCCTMNLTAFLASTVGFQLAFFTTQILLRGLFFHAKLLLTIYKTSKVWLFTVIAFVKGARMHG